MKNILKTSLILFATFLIVSNSEAQTKLNYGSKKVKQPVEDSLWNEFQNSRYVSNNEFL
jgi:hypothetical protein